MAIQPGPLGQQASSRSGDTAELDLRARRRRRPWLALLLVLVGLGGLAFAGLGVYDQLQPRKFTVAQQRRIEAWEVARRWRTMPKERLFPPVMAYQLAGSQLDSSGSLELRARRLEIARQETCSKVAGASPGLVVMLDHDGCQALLRATYTDASSSLVLTVGVAVLRDTAGATAAAQYLGDTATAGQGAATRHLVLRPLQVGGSPAALFGLKQRQLSWVSPAGPYLVLATVGYADGRPRVRVAGDSYADLEMTSLIRAIVAQVAVPLAAPPPVPHCPGALSAC